MLSEAYGPVADLGAAALVGRTVAGFPHAVTAEARALR